MNATGSFPTDIYEILRELECKKREILAREEETWCLDNNAIWIHESDKNTKLVHNFANMRKHLNTIWSINDQNGSLVSSLQDIKRLGIHHFKSIFSQLEGFPIRDILEALSLFPRSIMEDMDS